MRTDTGETFRVAVAQMDPHRSRLSHNRDRILVQMASSAEQGASLVVFPECAFSGYVFDSGEEALPAACTAEGPETEPFLTACRAHNLYAIIGFLEQDGGRLYNSALVVGPEGIVACYRKCHLPVLGIDRFVVPGDALPVLELPFARIGILICYDVRFPEAARSMALQGADVIVIPTNWPEGAESAPDFLTRARAWENRVFVVACNRVGVECGTRFIGRSQVIGPDGRFLAEADGESETLLFADIQPALARQKKLVIQPGVFELDPIGGRRPDLYGELTRRE